MKITGIALAGIIAIAFLTYTYFDHMFSDLSEAALFEEAQSPHHLWI